MAIKRMQRKIGRALQQAATLNKPLLNWIISNFDRSVRALRNKVLLRLGYETMRHRSELCAFKFEDICKGANGKPAIRLDFCYYKPIRDGRDTSHRPGAIRLIRKMEGHD